MQPQKFLCPATPLCYTEDMEQLCTLCPRRCGTDRSKTKGLCGAPDTLLLARAALHHWEEPCLSGRQGSGAVFFCGCNMGCAFCQNYDISQTPTGKPVTPARLQEIFGELKAQGAHNINLVTPTHYTEQLLPLLDGIDLPVVWNSSAFESVDTLRKLQGKVDIYLPDCKFSDPALAKQLSHAPDYPQVARDAIMEMYRQTGDYVMENGLLRSGVLIRHLVLPGYVENSLRVIDWVADTFSRGQVLFSLMSQYTPYRELDDPNLNRRLTKKEWIKVRNYMKKKGITEGYVQDLSSAQEEYTPAFDFTGI